MRIRITYSKTGTIIFTSAIDIQKIWERSIRRAGINILYSEGFHPLPKIQVASPLPVGFSGLNEKVDIWISGLADLDEIVEILQFNVPQGIIIKNAEFVNDYAKSLNSLINSAIFSINLLELAFPYEELSKKCQNLLDKNEIIRVRHEKKYDLRPLIKEISINNEMQSLYMHLLAKSGETGRPDEVLKELGIDPSTTEICRDAMVFAD